MDNYQEILKYKLLNITVNEYLYAIGVFSVLYIVFKIFKNVLLGKLKALAEATATGFDDELVLVLEKIHPYFYDLVALYFALKTLPLNDTVHHIINEIFFSILIIQAILSLNNFVKYILKKIFFNISTDAKDNETVIHAIELIAQIIIWITGILMLLSNLGINITSLAASLGIGGIAVALAIQNILGDIFSSFSIYFDKPFQVGDYIVVGTDSGNVTKIGLKTTRILTLQGEELVISNKELTSTRIQNFKKMETRRVPFGLGVTYDTGLESLKKIPEIIEGVFKAVHNANLDRVNFKEFGDFSLNFEIVYFHLSGSYGEYMATREEINLKIKEEFDKAGIEMAFPTQTLYVQK